MVGLGSAVAVLVGFGVVVGAIIVSVGTVVANSVGLQPDNMAQTKTMLTK